MKNSDTTCKPQLRVLKNHLVLKIMRKWQKKRLKIPILDNTNNKTKAHCTPLETKCLILKMIKLSSLSNISAVTCILIYIQMCIYTKLLHVQTSLN